MTKSMIGIDIGSSSLKLAWYRGGKLAALAEEPMPEKLAWDGRIVSAEAMAEFLKKTLKEQGIRGRRCSVVLPSAQVLVRRVTLPMMTEDQLLLNLPYEFRDFITEDKDKYYYDYAVLESVPAEGDTPGSLELFAAAAPKELIAEYNNLCRWAGLKLVTVIPLEAAFINLIREFVPQDEVQQERCFIDAGHTATRMYFYTGDRFETMRAVEQGGSALDDLLAESLGVDRHVAHVQKEGGEGLDQPQVQAMLGGIATDVMRALNFYGYNNPASTLENGWLCGGGERIVPLREDLIEMLNIRLRPISELIGTEYDHQLTSSCFAAIGAAIQETGR